MLDDSLHSSWVARHLAKDVELYIANSRAARDGRLPQLMFSDVTLRGSLERSDELADLLKQHPLITKTAGPPFGQ